jgi:hypothetical protein
MSIPSFRTPVTLIRGFIRFLGILIGWKAETSHEVATHSLLVVGFVIEGYILSQVILERFSHDFTGQILEAKPVVIIGLGIVIFLLLFHQFVVFRNFSLPKEIENRDHKEKLNETLKMTIEELQSGRSPQTLIEKLQKKASSANQSINEREFWDPKSKKLLEILTYGLFGVLTGEAGYMLTVLHEHDPSHWTARFFWAFFGTRGLAWGQTLECAFLFCAMAICVCVLVWDAIVTTSPRANQDYGDWLKTFWWNDGGSFCFWLCLFLVVTPNARWVIGVRIGSDSNAVVLGYCLYAWLFLLGCSSLYIFLTGARFLRGLKTLGTVPEYRDARFEKI